MRFLVAVILLLSIFGQSKGASVFITIDTCPPSNIKCLTDTDYTLCFIVGNSVIELNVTLKCQEGTFCTEEPPTPCIPGDQTKPPATTITTTTPSTTTPTPATTTETTTTETATTTTEPSTSTTTTETTTTSMTTSTTSSPTTTQSTTTITAATTTVAPVLPPDCKGTSGYYPAEKCNQYYVCVPSFLWWWYRPYIQTCPAGQAFNGKDGCEVSTTCTGVS